MGLNKENFSGEKLYYSVGEVSQMLEVEPYNLRYWETEFEQLNPKKTAGGQRRYRESDIELLGRIKKFLREDKYTVEGAKQQLENESTTYSGKKQQDEIISICEAGIEQINCFVEENL